MKVRWLQLRRGLPARGWVVILPSLVIVALALAFTGRTSAAPAPQPRVLLSDLLFQQQQPLCQNCHPDEYAVWKNSVHAKATLDPEFQAQLSKSQNQQACLQCHTTGFDSGSGKFLSEGVTCEACHGPYKEGHPAGQTMKLPMESVDTCRMCHQTAFQEWEKTKHAEQKIECFDCHQAHTQGVRTGSPEKLCAACHSDQQTKLAHSVHGISGVDCGSCHMAKEMKDTATTTGVQLSVSSHSFAVPADVCNRCHSDVTHASNVLARASQLPQVGMADAQQLQQANARVKELEDQAAEMDNRLNSLRNVSVVGLGLAFGSGGFLGLLVGIGGITLLKRRGVQ
ncbi:MAG: multiheme c-type cytochrome [Chloroflexi bacterium]|nr:multiheme c-type cytochrome [Chloroflexota bacterium]